MAKRRRVTWRLMDVTEFNEVRPMEQWIDTVVAAGMHPAVAALIETFNEPGVEKYPKLLRTKEAWYIHI